MTRRPFRHVPPSVVARWLGVKLDTVLKWIHAGDLPALNIGTTGRLKRYLIFRRDLAAFLRRRGLSEETVTELLDGAAAGPSLSNTP